jgi:serine/threonine protein kinase
VTELLGTDVYSVLKEKKYKGFTLPVVSKILRQLLEGMVILKSLGIVHSDLKPENIIVDKFLPNVKIIDFGSAAFEKNRIFTYIQSRYYRSPEILLENTFFFFFFFYG